MRILKESENISDCDLEVYSNHIDKLREDFKIRFGDLRNVHVSELLVALLDMKIDNIGYESYLDEPIEMHVEFEVVQK